MRKQLYKQLAVGAMAAVLTVTSLPLSALAAPKAYTGGGNVQVQTQGDTVTFGNDAIQRTFSKAGKKLKTTEIVNKRINKTFTPADGSEEFVVNTTKKNASEQQPLDQTGWTATADSEETAEEGATHGFARNLIDNNPNTIWHTQYSGNKKPAMPHEVVIDLKKPTSFAAFGYTPRFVGGKYDINGNIKGYELYVSNDETAKAADDAHSWKKVANGDFNYEGFKGQSLIVNLEQPQTARLVKLKATSNVKNNEFAGGVEFDLYAQKYAPVKNDRAFKSSQLTLKDNQPVASDVTDTVNGHQKTGKKLTFEYEPFQFKGVDYTISENFVMYNGDHYMRKFLSISVPNAQAQQAEIDYIDLESMNVDGDDTTWTIPTKKGGIVEMEEFKANLGQPYYIDGMFFGCEFPETDTQIVSNNARPRYYSGKTFERLALDNQAARGDDGSIHYNTWQTVAGAAEGTDTSVIQSAFFDYINDIAVPSDFRIQYNSWFDNMMEIDNKNILESFKEMDKNLAANDVRPLNSYVVDDGWNNYNDTDQSVDVAKSGTGKNNAGFWTFNSKFPDGFTSSSALVQDLGSDFGAWVGPRGGYNFQNHLANILIASGNGSRANGQGGDIDVADRRYVKKFEEMAKTWQQDYKLNYWKWDGFAQQKQYNTWQATDGVPGREHEHMIGGTHQMYHVTDLWEAWIDLFENVRAAGNQQNINKLWISLTCYVNPSPWFLQWANSVWLQCGPDQAGAGDSKSQMDRQMNARDAAYYNYIKEHQFQFPLAHVYNHDPVYGQSGTGMKPDTATAEQFQNYLYTIAGRGTAFWELYYSPSLLDNEKFEVTGEFLNWAEANHHMLRNAKMFGGTPASGVTLSTGPNKTSPTVEVASHAPYNTYGYAGFDGDEGILTIRNADWNKAQDVTFTFDAATLGVSGNAGDTFEYFVERNYNQDGKASKVAQTGTFTYGQSYTWNLQPEESLTVRVSKKKEAVAPKIAAVRSNGKNSLTVKMSEKVKGDAKVTINGQAVDASKVKKSADDTTFHIELADSVKNGQKLSVAVSNVTDMAGNKVAADPFEYTFHTDGVVASRCSSRLNGEAKSVAAADASLASANGLTVSSVFEGTGTGYLVKQEGAYELGVDRNGKAYFTVNGATATSDAIVNDGARHSIFGVKENNGIVKVYVDGQLQDSSYKKENAAFATPAADILLGAKGLAGKASAKVYDYALGFDAIAKEHQKLFPDMNERNLALNKVPTVGHVKSQDEVTVNNDKPLRNATNGNKGKDDYADFGASTDKTPMYMQVDLGDVYEINKVNLIRYFQDHRTYNGSAIVLSEDTTFDKNDTIVYNADKDNVFGLGAGKGETYQETSEGKSWTVKDGARARYVRVYVNGKSDSGSNHVVELEVMGRAVAPESQELDVQKLYDRIDAVRAEIAKGIYTDESVAKVEAKLDEAERVADCAKTQDEVDAALKSLDGIEKMLVLAGTDKPEPNPEPNPEPSPEPGKPEPGKPEPGKPGQGGTGNGSEGGHGSNGAGGSSDSGNSGSTSKPAQGSESAKPSKGGLAQTGDNAFGSIVLAAAAGVVLLGAGIIVSKRRGMRE